jgi:4-methyl-5(b-hydroxyethyl)-thiazole monophosphate biosynthesis
MKKVLVPLADGFEEIEAITIIDVLRRAEIDVVLASLADSPVVGAHGVKIIADRNLGELYQEDFEMIVLPGGQPGSDNLANDERLTSMLQRQHRAGKGIAAICAAPMVLSKAGILKGKSATAYPGFAEGLMADNIVCDKDFVIDGNIVTSRGPGTAMAFSLGLVGILAGPGVVEKLKTAMLIKS